jgi:hypothetical protein
VDLLGGLLDRVLHFLQVHFADYVEAVVGCHGGQGTRFEVRGSRLKRRPEAKASIHSGHLLLETQG